MDEANFYFSWIVDMPSNTSLSSYNVRPNQRLPFVPRVQKLDSKSLTSPKANHYFTRIMQNAPASIAFLDFVTCLPAHFLEISLWYPETGWGFREIFIDLHHADAK